MKVTIYFNNASVRDIEEAQAIYFNKHTETYDIRYKANESLTVKAIPAAEVARISIRG